MPEITSSYKSAFLSAGVALVATLAALVICRTSFISWLGYTLVFLPDKQQDPLPLMNLGVASADNHVEDSPLRRNYAGASARTRAAPSLTSAAHRPARTHSLVSDAHRSPSPSFHTTCPGRHSGVIAAQAQRLWNMNSKLTERLIHSSSKLNSLQADKTRARLSSGLKLLDTMLSPQEIIVFQRDLKGELVTAARLRTQSNVSLDSSRNSTWRESIALCEQALKTHCMNHAESCGAETSRRQCGVAAPS